MKSTITLSLTICAAALVAATVAAGEEPTMAKLGEPVPDFTLVDAAGVKRSLSDYKGKLVVLEWINPQCPFVQGCYKTKAMQKAYEKVKVLDKGVAWLAINTTWNTTQQENQLWIRRYELEYPILLDFDGDVGRLYDARKTPHMYVIDKAQDAPHVRHRQGRHPALPRGDR
ncbi:MAG: redoxin domain-containing protein [Planctomycetota bacterium]|jgi:peroxiredoxin